jgi:hypothetical protein
MRGERARTEKGKGGGFITDDRAWDLWLSEGNKWHKIGNRAQLRSDAMMGDGLERSPRLAAPRGSV